MTHAYCAVTVALCAYATLQGVTVLALWLLVLAIAGG